MHCQFTTVMTVVGIEIVREGEGGGCCRATVPACTVHKMEGCDGERAAARVLGAGDAGRGASSTAGKREGISF